MVQNRISDTLAPRYKPCVLPFSARLPVSCLPAGPGRRACLLARVPARRLVCILVILEGMNA